MKATFFLTVVLIFLLIFSGCGNGGSEEFIEESGTVETTDIILSSKIAGTVDKILFDEGVKVENGDTLLIVDYETLDIQLKQAEAMRSAAEAQLDLLVTGARKEDIISAENALEQAKVNYELAKKDFERMKNLFDSQVITKKQLDDVTARFEVAKSQLNTAEQSYKKIKNYARDEDIKRARANLDQTEANVDLIRKNISDCFVVSPINGFVVESFVEEGEFVAPNSSVFKVADLSKVEMMIYISEEDLGKVKLGQKAELFNDTFKDKAYEGKVIYISPEAEFTPKSIQTKDERTKLVYAVKISVPNPNFELKSGMPADAKVYLD